MKGAPVSLPHGLGLLVVIASFATSSTLLGLDNGQVRDAEVLLEVLLDKSLPYRDRVSALQDVSHLSAQTKGPLLLRVIREADDDFAIGGAISAIEQGVHTTEVIGAIQIRLTNWGLSFRCAMVQSIVHAGSPISLTALIRDSLRLLIPRMAKNEQEVETGFQTVNYAAFALLKDRKPEDVKLFQDAVRAYPEAYIGWVALDRLKGMDDEMLGLARSVYTSNRSGKHARVGAIIAAQDKDPKAPRIALGIIRAYLEEFSEQPLVELAAAAYKDRAGAEVFSRMNREQSLVSMLGFIRSDEARDLAIANVNASNREIRILVQLVCAKNWSQELKVRWTEVLAEDRGFLRAMISHFHPESDLSGMPAGQESNEAVESLKKELSSPLEAHRLALLD